MVRRSTLSQQVTNSSGTFLLEWPYAVVDIFNVINGDRTMKMTFSRGINWIKWILIICNGTYYTDVDFLHLECFFYFMHPYFHMYGVYSLFSDNISYWQLNCMIKLYVIRNFSSMICRNVEFPVTYTAESRAYSQLPANHVVITLDCNQPRYYQTRVNSGWCIKAQCTVSNQILKKNI